MILLVMSVHRSGKLNQVIYRPLSVFGTGQGSQLSTTVIGTSYHFKHKNSLNAVPNYVKAQGSVDAILAGPKVWRGDGV